MLSSPVPVAAEGAGEGGGVCGVGVGVGRFGGSWFFGGSGTFDGVAVAVGSGVGGADAVGAKSGTAVCAGSGVCAELPGVGVAVGAGAEMSRTLRKAFLAPTNGPLVELAMSGEVAGVLALGTPCACDGLSLPPRSATTRPTAQRSSTTAAIDPAMMNLRVLFSAPTASAVTVRMSCGWGFIRGMVAPKGFGGASLGPGLKPGWDTKGAQPPWLWFVMSGAAPL